MFLDASSSVATTVFRILTAVLAFVAMHPLVNEAMTPSAPVALTASCRVSSSSLVAVALNVIGVVNLALAFLPPAADILLGLSHLGLGLYLNLALKPAQWTGALRYEDCNVFSTSHTLLHRIMMSSYVLIIWGATEIVLSEGRVTIVGRVRPWTTFMMYINKIRRNFWVTVPPSFGLFTAILLVARD